MFDLVIFGLDGTLVDSAAEIAAAVDDLLGEQGLPVLGEARLAEWVGDGTRELLTRAYAEAAQIESNTLRRVGTVDRLLPRFAEFQARRRGTRSRLYPGVGETLRELRAARIPVAVVSNREQREAASLLLGHQIRHFFDMVIGGDTLDARLPDPQPLRFPIEQFKATRPVLIGASCLELDAARAAGIPMWAVPYGYDDGIAAARPCRMIPGVAALIDALASPPPQRRAA